VFSQLVFHFDANKAGIKMSAKFLLSLTAWIYGGQTGLVVRQRWFVFIKPFPWFCRRASRLPA